MKTTNKTNVSLETIEAAIRDKTRFQSSKGDLTLEQLWDVPLRPGTGSDAAFSLNDIAKWLKSKVKASEDNFVDNERPTPAQIKAEQAFNIVMYVINTKKAEEADAKDRAEKKSRRRQLEAALADKQAAALAGKSEAQIKKELAELDDE